MTGGAFDDTIDGGSGDDYVDAQGWGAATVTCGPGFDVVHYDASDAVAGDCEIQPS